MTLPTNETHYLLYGFSLSYFSRKLEAALDWYGVDYDFVHKTPDVAPEIEKRSGTRQVPVLVTPSGNYLADTTPTLWHLDARYPDRAMFPPGLTGALAQIVEEFLDEWLTRTVMHYRWNFRECADNAAGILGQEAAPQASELVASMLSRWGSKVVRARGMTSAHMQQAGENEWVRLMDALEKQLAHTAYALGDRPCAVDATLLGGLRGHFLADPVPARILNDYPTVSNWARKTHVWPQQVALSDAFEENPFLSTVLEEMSGSYRTYILANRDAIAAGKSFFECESFGESVSFKAQAYTEHSRMATQRRLKDVLSQAEYAELLSLLGNYHLTEVFGLP